MKNKFKELYCVLFGDILKNQQFQNYQMKSCNITVITLMCNKFAN